MQSHVREIVFIAVISLLASTVAVTAQVAIVPLTGQAGILLRQEVPITESFDAAYLGKALEYAEGEGVKLIVLQIDSSAGYAFERNRVCELLQQWRGRMEIVVYADRAISAAGTVTLSCPRIVVGPNCTLGAGLVLDAATGNTINERALATESAQVRNYIQNAGRSGEIADALTIQTLQLWWHPDAGFANRTTTFTRTSGGTAYNPNHSGGGAEWTKLDGEFSLLTLAAGQMVETGLAEAMASTVNDAVDLVAPDVEIIDLSRYLDTLRANRAIAYRRAQKHYKMFEEGLDELGEKFGELNVATDRRKGRLRSEIDTLLARMIAGARTLERMSTSDTAVISVCDLEVCQLRQAAKDLVKVQEHLRKRENSLVGADLKAARVSWNDCTTAP